MDQFKKIYNSLLVSYGPQEWWPAGNNFNPRELEICVGAILTQNTNWKNVELAIANMKDAGLTDVLALSCCSLEMIEKAIRPSGFYRQKAKRLKSFSLFIQKLGSFKEFSKHITREELLRQKGIGPETADSILLYALGRPVFVIDSYTKRIFSRNGISPNLTDYESWKNMFEKNMEPDKETYQEYHALIVELAKRNCKIKPICSNCPIGKECKKLI